MLKWSLEVIELPLKFAWTISRGTSFIKKNFIVTVRDGNGSVGRGEVAFNARYHESEEQTKTDFELFQKSITGDIEELSQFPSIIASLNLAASLQFGLESALAELLSIRKGISISELLGVKEVKSVKTSFSLPIMSIGELRTFIDKYDLQRFHCLKIKVEKDSALETVQEILKSYNGLLRVDANESWTDVKGVLDFVQSVGAERLEFLEQPMPAHLVQESIELKKNCPCVLIADESITDGEINPSLVDSFDGVNVKLMKSGGYLKALKQLNKARSLGLKTMLGCMLETSLGISSALHIASEVDYLDLDGFLILKKDPFNLLREEAGILHYS
jgi:L-alanine-DL-glutamate epimerase-like enolase superfamily enzyme